MILGQIGEEAHVELNARHPVEVQGMGRDLHNHMGAARVGHLPEQGLELQAFGGGPLGREHLLADHILNGAHQTHLGPQTVLQQVLEKIGGGSLSVGAGDAQHGHFLRRVAVPIGGGQSQPQPGIGQPDIAALGGRSLAEDAGRPPLLGHGNILVAVGIEAPDGHEEVAGLHGAGVIGNAGDRGLRISAELQGVEPPEQFLEFHGKASCISQNQRGYAWPVNPGRYGW